VEPVSDDADGAWVAVLIESSDEVDELLDEPLPVAAALAVDVPLWFARPTARAPVPSAAAAATEAVTARTRRRPRRRSSKGSEGVAGGVMSASVARASRRPPWPGCGLSVRLLPPSGEPGSRARDTERHWSMTMREAFRRR